MGYVDYEKEARDRDEDLNTLAEKVCDLISTDDEFLDVFQTYWNPGELTDENVEKYHRQLANFIRAVLIKALEISN